MKPCRKRAASATDLVVREVHGTSMPGVVLAARYTSGDQRSIR